MAIHHIIRVLKAPLIAVGLVKKPKVRPTITVPKVANRLTPSQIWGDKTFATREPKPTPPPSRLILSETDEVAIPYIPYTPECPAKTIGDQADVAYPVRVPPVRRPRQPRPRKSAVRATAMRATAKEKAFSGYMDDVGYSKAVKKGATKPATRAKAKARTKTKSRAKTKAIRHNVGKSWLE